MKNNMRQRGVYRQYFDNQSGYTVFELIVALILIAIMVMIAILLWLQH